jgi:hypothetical protein
MPDKIQESMPLVSSRPRCPHLFHWWAGKQEIYIQCDLPVHEPENGVGKHGATIKGMSSDGHVGGTAQLLINWSSIQF